MRKTKTLEISGIEKPVVVYELKVKQIISLIQGDPLGDLSIEGLKEQLDTKILPMCSSISLDQLLEMAPSEAEEVWNAFKEVNSTFFEMARRAGLQEILTSSIESLKKAMLVDFSKLHVGSSNQDILTS